MSLDIVTTLKVRLSRNRCSTREYEFAFSKAFVPVVVLTQSPISAEGAFSVGKAAGA